MTVKCERRLERALAVKAFLTFQNIQKESYEVEEKKIEEGIFSPDPVASQMFMFLPQSPEEMTHCTAPFLRSTKTLPIGQTDHG